MSPISENVFLYVCMPTSSELISSTQQNRFQHRDHCRTPMSTRHISSTSSTTLYTTVYFLDQRIPNYMSLTIVGRRAYSFNFNYFMLWTSTRCDIIKAIIWLTGMVVGMQRVNSWSELSCAEYGPVPRSTHYGWFRRQLPQPIQSHDWCKTLKPSQPITWLILTKLCPTTKNNTKQPEQP